MTSEQILKEAEALNKLKDTQISIWEDLSRICFPRSSGVLTGTKAAKGTDAQADRGRMAENFDGTAMRACNILATGQAARITPMGSRWFVLRPPVQLRDSQMAQNWFAECSEIMAIVLGQSNFYNRAYEVYQHRGAFGVSALETLAGKNNKGLHFRSFPIGSYAIAENAMDEVDVISRTYSWSPMQCAEAYGGRDKLPKSINDKLNDASKAYEPTEEIIHHVKPRTERQMGKIDSKNKPIGSWHVHKETGTILMVSGYDSIPIAVSRWQTVPYSAYGWGPADYALPEAAQANYMEELQDTLAELQAFPRILYPSGFKDEIDLGPHGLTSFDPTAADDARPQEWLTGGRYDVWKDRAGDKKAAIQAAFFTELFTAISQLSPTATATQIDAIVTENRELFHPIYSNMVREFHTPVLRRCFQICLQQGLFPEPPAEVVELDNFGAFISDPEVEYVSSMALALEQGRLGNLNEVIGTCAQMAQFDPAWIEPFNPATIVPDLMRAKGLPASYQRTPEELEQREKARQEAAAMQQALGATEAVRNVGGVSAAKEAADELS